MAGILSRQVTCHNFVLIEGNKLGQRTLNKGSYLSTQAQSPAHSLIYVSRQIVSSNNKLYQLLTKTYTAIV